MESFKLDILIVEDNLSFSLELAILVNDIGYNVIGPVDNAKEALELIYGRKPDIILMDHEIKGDMMGIELGEKIQHLKNPALFTSWLFRIAHNRCIDKAKDRQRHQTVSSDGPFQFADTEFDLESALAKESDIDRIALLMQELSPEARTILLAKYCEGRSIHELTELWGISESAVKMRLARARNRVLSLYNRNRVAS